MDVYLKTKITFVNGKVSFLNSKVVNFVSFGHYISNIEEQHRLGAMRPYGWPTVGIKSIEVDQRTDVEFINEFEGSNDYRND